MRGVGEMNHRVVLRVRDVDAQGKVLDTWRNLYADDNGKCWAAKQEMSNKQYHQAAAEQTELTAIYTVRTPKDVTLDSGLRILEGSATYESVGVPIPNKPRRGFTEIRAVLRSMEGYGNV